MNFALTQMLLSSSLEKQFITSEKYKNTAQGASCDGQEQAKLSEFWEIRRSAAIDK
ncbi:hypothetical protein ACU8KH_06019 [Lachancea thermotolerans]